MLQHGFASQATKEVLYTPKQQISAAQVLTADSFAKNMKMLMVQLFKSLYSLYEIGLTYHSQLAIFFEGRSDNELKI